MIRLHKNEIFFSFRFVLLYEHAARLFITMLVYNNGVWLVKQGIIKHSDMFNCSHTRSRKAREAVTEEQEEAVVKVKARKGHKSS